MNTSKKRAISALVVLLAISIGIGLWRVPPPQDKMPSSQLKLLTRLAELETSQKVSSHVDADFTILIRDPKDAFTSAGFSNSGWQIVQSEFFRDNLSCQIAESAKGRRIGQLELLDDVLIIVSARDSMTTRLKRHHFEQLALLINAGREEASSEKKDDGGVSSLIVPK